MAPRSKIRDISLPKGAKKVQDESQTISYPTLLVSDRIFETICQRLSRVLQSHLDIRHIAGNIAKYCCLSFHFEDMSKTYHKLVRQNMDGIAAISPSYKAYGNILMDGTWSIMQL